MSKLSIADQALIERRTAAWNNRPIISTEMFAKTSWEKKAVKKAMAENKAGLKTYQGKKELLNVQNHIKKLKWEHPVSFTSITLSK